MMRQLEITATSRSGVCTLLSFDLLAFDIKLIDHKYCRGALKFAILSVIESTATVFLNNGFHQKGIAADPASAAPG